VQRTQAVNDHVHVDHDGSYIRTAIMGYLRTLPDSATDPLQSTALVIPILVLGSLHTN
jgi:hypothetical protein